MRKIATILAIVMIVMTLPVLPAYAEDPAHYLKGIGDNEYIIINEETSRTLTLVDFANKGKLPTAPTGVEKVEFFVNGTAPENKVGEADASTDYTYELEFEACGVYQLYYNVYVGGAPTAYGPFTYNVIAGTKTEDSFFENFDTMTDYAEYGARINDRQATTNKATVTITEGKVSITEPSTANGGRSDFYVNKNIKVAADNTTPGDANILYYRYKVQHTSPTINQRIFFGNVLLLDTKVNVISGTEERQEELIIDLNNNIAIVRLDGEEFNRVDISGKANNNVYHQFFRETITFDDIYFANYNIKAANEIKSSSIPGGDNIPETTSLDKISFTGEGFFEEQNLTGKVEITPAVAFTPSIEENKLVVDFTEELTPGTTYTVSVNGVLDGDRLAYKPYSFSFRTLRVGENPFPIVSITEPLADTRFKPGDIITLKAEATDSASNGGYIEFVEFLCNGVPIEGGRLEKVNGENPDPLPAGWSVEGDVYTYEWEQNYDSLDPYLITAKAGDNEEAVSTSAAVGIKIISLREPTVSISSPENGKALINRLSGITIESDTKPIIKFETEDLDGTIAKVEVRVDGEKDGEITDNAATATTYTLVNALTLGDHEIEVGVYDNDGHYESAKVNVRVADFGKTEDAILDVDVTKYGEWMLDKGSAKYGPLAGFDNIQGLILGTNDAETATISRSYTGQFNDSVSFSVDFKVAFSDNTTKRTITFGEKDLVIFDANGKTNTGSYYFPGEVYHISAVYNGIDKKMYVFLDGKAVSNAAHTLTQPTAIKITQVGAAGTSSETAITYVNLSKLAEAAAVPVVTLYDADNNVVTTSGNVAYGTIVFGDVQADLNTIIDNLKVVNTVTNKAVDLSFAGGKFTINEVLKANTRYDVIVLPGARDTNGKASCGTVTAAGFTTAQENTAATLTVAGGAVADETFTATLTVTLGVEAPANPTVVYAAYEGSKMVDKGIVPLDGFNGSISLTGVTDNTVIEAFVVDNMTDLNPITDTIFRLK